MQQQGDKNGTARCVQSGAAPALRSAARHLSELVDKLETKNVTLRILNFGGDAVDTRGATGRLMLNMFAAMAPV